jgi:D-tyrosyl-tRNA(Tyr) deacylase
VRAVVQRVSRASVTVGGREVGAIGPGLVVLLGVRRGDTTAEAEWLADKVAGLRIFGGEGGTFDRGLADLPGGALLVVSQFTLYGDTRKGRRPNFGAAAPPHAAEALYEHFVAHLRAAGWPVATGVFGAMMEVALVNDGPVTVLVEREAPAGAPADAHSAPD